jgi:ADP-ribosyl-[dinitrogen reductase] hydrolase
LKNKILGGIFGLAIGDALGGTTEFMSQEEIANVYGKVTKIIGGGFWNLKPGETTDDTAMTIAVA